MDSRVKNQKGKKLFRRETLEGYLFISPWIIGTIIFSLGPIVASIVLSLHKWRLFDQPQFVGFGNYAKLSSDPLFWKSLFNTFYYTAFAVPLGLVGSLFLAALLNQRLRGVSIYRAIYYLPCVAAGVSTILLWKWIFNPEFGLLNAFLRRLGLPTPGWLTSEAWAMPALIIMSLWGIGGGMIIFLAGLQSIPEVFYEAAEVDGANSWQKFRHVTLPLLTPTIFFNLVMGIIASFQVFGQAYIMTRGGPNDATLFYVLYLFQNAFEYFHMGYACALAWVLFAIILTFTLIQFKLARRWVHYQ